MARRFARRKPRVVWLPVHGRDFSDGTPENFGNGIGGSLTVFNDGQIYTDIQPVTFDYSDSSAAEEGTEFRSLQDLTSGNAYRLRRIVGKCHIAALQENNSEAEFPCLDVAAGFMVCRTDSSGNVLSDALDAAGNKVSGPLAQDGAEDPWIWRRRWFLTPLCPILSYTTGSIGADQFAVQTALGIQGQWPHTTAHYGSVQDGPHIDQKTARVISREERLTFWLQSRVTNGAGNSNNGTLVWNLDLRLLASLRSQSGNRRNASR